ncbi:hypothetical protein ACJIZ3_017805 [Penstemon smallii]|uniref:non-specific serine/threonine protein kinase n=1 Tax=Penstemon smallii TaxID=265156 RepID=A0ABD3SXR4_9LAMI
MVTYAKFGMSLIVCLCWWLLLIGANSQRTDPKEVNALRSIKDSLIDPYRNLAHWNRRDPCTSNWTGIICYNTTLDDGYLHVKELLFLARNLSGSLSPHLGRLSYLEILDFMWNNITGTIPKEIGNITTLKLLLLNGNQLTGSLPDELGYLSNLDRIQVDQNQISGPIPLSFANLKEAKHFHMNNNSLSGQIPPKLSQLKNLLHLLLDNNNLSGYLPPELSEIPKLRILQLDNNNFDGSIIPSSYFNMSDLLKLSLRNCSVQGQIPNWSNMPNIAYIVNQLNGSIPRGPLSGNITTIDLSNNNLNGTIPSSFSNLPHLQKLSVANNSLSGSIPSIIWLNRTLNSSERLFLDFENNMFSIISGSFFVPPNVTIGLQGNPMCSNDNLVQLCGSHEEDFGSNALNITKINGCPSQSCPPPYEYAPPSPVISCFCAAPLLIGYRLKSPGFSDFLPYVNPFKQHLTSGLRLNLSQLEIDSVAWQKGPRLRMYLKIFPSYVNDNVRLFKKSEVLRIREMFSGWTIPDKFPSSSPSGISKGAMAGIILGTIAVSLTISAFVFLLILRLRFLKSYASSKRPSRISIRIDDVKDFTYGEMALATSEFNSSSIVGQGGYGKVYRGILADGTVVAIKRAQEGSLQGENEFLTEIELLSRLHHRNLVKLIGYCDEEDEQMLVYEFMPNGTLRDHLSGTCKSSLTFAMRVRIALGSARGIHYLHSEANPPIFHRDIKASNILLDSKFTVKVADFGLSRLAPLPELEGAMPSHVSTVVKGTPGYLDPEYFLTHKLTDKSDVYSLGVVFLELLTAMHPISHGKNIVREVNIAYRSGMIFSVVDENMGSYPSECLVRFMNLALKCCQDVTEDRPSMAEVVRELEDIWFMMPEPYTKITESFIAEYPGKVTTPSSSSTSSMKNPSISQDVSGSDLYEVVSTVIPRWMSYIIVTIKIQLIRNSKGFLCPFPYLCFSRFQTPVYCANTQRTDPNEVNALRSIKKSLVDPYKKLAHWNRRDPCTSNWPEIICYNRTLDDGFLHVRELALLNRNLSGSLSPELGSLSYLEILNFMWNNITGTIPKEIGNITTLRLLLLNGNQLTGSLPDELGYLSNLDRIQIDQNQISGPIPVSFANLTKAKHLLLDNNNLSGLLPPELSETPNLLIIQLDNNNFDGSIIPSSYGNMSHLLKLSLRNCSVQGPIPDWSNLPSIAYIDLSLNQLNGSIPTGPLPDNFTTIDLSNNSLTGTIPSTFSSLPRLQKLSVANNSLSGSISSMIWLNRTLNSFDRLFLDFENNMFSNISGGNFAPPNVTIGLQGNPVCSNNNLVQFCGSYEQDIGSNILNSSKIHDCPSQSCPPPYEYAPASPVISCFCAAPLLVGYRLKSPGFWDFLPYVDDFKGYLTSGLRLNLSQLEIDSVAWQKGPRLRMYLKIFPSYVNDSVRSFNDSEIFRIRQKFGEWDIPDSKVFGPFELLNFTLSNEIPSSSPSGISKGALAGIILGAIAGSVTLSTIIAFLIMRLYFQKKHASSKRRPSTRISMKIDGVKDFTYGEMALATNNFISSSEIGQGGYGKVYRGILADGTVVAIKRAQEGSLQGETEFLTEIELLSRVHHRNLVSLIGYCDEQGEQMLVYEFMPNGTLRDHLSGKGKLPLSFAMRVGMALGSARGIHYLHSEANPPIFHRDIKASNILLDSKFTAKVADFGLSKLAPLPELEGDAPAHVSTVVKGTPGYLDPEYFLTQKLTDKSDVYSLGVVFLELLTALHPISHGKNIVREANTAYRSGMILSLVDEQMGSYPSECVEKFLNLALKCCQDATDARPSMGEVVRELENIWFMIPEPDTKITEYLVANPGKVMTPSSSSASSSSFMKNSFVSQDVSGSELLSGVVPTVMPR